MPYITDFMLVVNIVSARCHGIQKLPQSRFITIITADLHSIQLLQVILIYSRKYITDLTFLSHWMWGLISSIINIYITNWFIVSFICVHRFYCQRLLRGMLKNRYISPIYWPFFASPRTLTFNFLALNDISYIDLGLLHVYMHIQFALSTRLHTYIR